jgi:thiamine biosynthesis lipoprotein
MRPELTVETHAFDALGTRCALFAIGQPRRRLQESEGWVRRMEMRLTRFSPDSELSRLNGAGGEWVAVGPETTELLLHSLRAFETSGGLVNVAVLPSILAAGYTRSFQQGPTDVRLDGIAALPPLPEVLEVGNGRARVASGAGIDLGGIAKGWMADRLVKILGPNAVANIGGDLRAAGGGPGGDGWPVGVGGRTLLLREQAAATSSVRRRRWGDGLHHLIDPRSGRPARTGLEEVSVVASSGVDAEITAKTALLLGPGLAPAYCAGHALAWWLDGPRDC